MVGLERSESDAEKTDWLAGVRLEDLTDEEYFLRMRAVGLRARQWDDRYIGLLVGAVERDLARKRGFHDAYHMAAVQARMPRKRVAAILAIARAIRHCPRLWRLFTRAEVAWTKVRAVARLACRERDDELCDAVRRHTRKFLEYWVREQMADRARPGFWKGGTARTGSVDAPTSDARDDAGGGVQQTGAEQTGGTGAATGPTVGGPGEPGLLISKSRSDASADPPAAPGAGDASNGREEPPTCRSESPRSREEVVAAKPLTGRTSSRTERVLLYLLPRPGHPSQHGTTQG